MILLYNTGGEDGDETEKLDITTIVFNEAVPSSDMKTVFANREACTNVTGRVIFTRRHSVECTLLKIIQDRVKCLLAPLIW